MDWEMILILCIFLSFRTALEGKAVIVEEKKVIFHWMVLWDADLAEHLKKCIKHLMWFSVGETNSKREPGLFLSLSLTPRTHRYKQSIKMKICRCVDAKSLYTLQQNDKSNKNDTLCRERTAKGLANCVCGNMAARSPASRAQTHHFCHR